MDEFQKAALETVRGLTLQIMLISAGVFGIVGGFISASGKTFRTKGALLLALLAFALSTLAGYVLHGALVSLLSASKFDLLHPWVSLAGQIQIGLFVLGGVLFVFFVSKNL